MTSDEISNGILPLGKELFASDDRKVINWSGENYYKSCGAYVTNLPDGGQSFCTKRENHPGHIHEDFDGQTREEYTACFDELTLEEAIYQALGAASVCWSNLRGAGVFDSSRAAHLGKELLKRVKNEGSYDNCGICGSPIAKHTIRRDSTRINGYTALRPVGWDCPKDSNG